MTIVIRPRLALRTRQSDSTLRGERCSIPTSVMTRTLTRSMSSTSNGHWSRISGAESHLTDTHGVNDATGPMSYLAKPTRNQYRAPTAADSVLATREFLMMRCPPVG